MLSAGFRPAIPAIERPQAHTLDRTVTEIDFYYESYTTRKHTVKKYKKINIPVTGPVVAQRVGRGIALLFHNRGTRMG